MKGKMIELGKLITLSKIPIEIEHQKRYNQVTIKMYHKGITKRGQIAGVEIGSKQYLAKKNQFIVSKIDARNGAMGLVPGELHNSVVTGDFLLFDNDVNQIDINYLNYITSTKQFDYECVKASSGSTNRRRLNVEKFFRIKIPVPPLFIQERIVRKLDVVKFNSFKINQLRIDQNKDIKNLLFSTFKEITQNSPRITIKEVAPVTRKQIEIDIRGEYLELGVRGFGRGIFHKSKLLGSDLTWQKLYEINEGDLVISNIKAWEGAIAVAEKKDNNRVASHRYLTCKVKEDKILAKFLCAYLLYPEGLEKIQKASPGSVDRNRTLAVNRLEKIEVPTPTIEKQREFISLQEKIQQMVEEQKTTAIQLEQLMPNLLNKAFKGEL